MSVAYGRAHLPDRLAIGLTAPHCDRAVRGDELPEGGEADRLELRDEVEVAGRERPDERDVDPVQVVDGENDASVARHALGPVQTRTRHEARGQAHVDAPGRPEEVAAGHAGW